MRTITVGEYVLTVMYAGTSPFEDRLKMQIYFGEMGIGQLANILDGNNGIVYEYTEEEVRMEYTGYSKLTKIEFVDNETVVAFLEYAEKQPQEA